MNTGALLNRIDFAVQVGSGWFPDTAVEMWPPWRSLAMATFEQQVDGGVATVAARPNLRDLVGLALGSPEFQRR